MPNSWEAYGEVKEDELDEEVGINNFLVKVDDGKKYLKNYDQTFLGYMDGEKRNKDKRDGDFVVVSEACAERDTRRSRNNEGRSKRINSFRRILYYYYNKI